MNPVSPFLMRWIAPLVRDVDACAVEPDATVGSCEGSCEANGEEEEEVPLPFATSVAGGPLGASPAAGVPDVAADPSVPPGMAQPVACEPLSRSKSAAVSWGVDVSMAVPEASPLLPAVVVGMGKLASAPALLVWVSM